ncbi:MAG: aminotransferase class I/II-fold pyridoxal phosphate-dependent enzyme [Bacteroidales bacterium]|nr:aminotransferase class I/II-fold pyridoxal phosphate-dependent enzyme [Bacteroidales bacterium]
MNNNLFIDLRSDTVTRPTPGMLEAMMTAKVGDDVLGEDPSVNALEEKMAEMFGKQAAVYCPSGTMTNQIAINVHVRPGDEVICDQTAHIYNFEGGGIARNSSASVRLLQGDRGRYTAEDVQANINPDNIHTARTRLVEIENTVNKAGGSYWDINEIKKIREVVDKFGLKLHLDGARLFNAIVETGEKPKEYGDLFDSISICLSKGLGAPVGSVLLGTSEFIKEARRTRKAFGGAMRQAGFMAAAGLYALNNNINRLKEDHQRAKAIADVLAKQSYVEEVYPAQTNIIAFKLKPILSDKAFIESLRERNIHCAMLGPQVIRMVTHLDFTDEMLDLTVGVLGEILK